MGREARERQSTRSARVTMADGREIDFEARHAGCMENGVFALDLADGSSVFFAAGEWKHVGLGPLSDQAAPLVIVPKA